MNISKNLTYFYCIAVSLSGILFGYTLAIIAGANLFIVKRYQLDSLDLGLIVGLFLIGALVGAYFSRFICDTIGRKLSLFISILFLILGTCFLSFSEGFFYLVLGRALTGIGVGISSVVAPMYLAEIAPTDKRGRFVSIYQLAITLGILIAFSVSMLFAKTQDFRSMFLTTFVFISIQVFALFFVKENTSIQEIEEEIPLKKLFSRQYKKPILIGIGMSLIQQLTGINTVICYAPKIFQTVSNESDFSSIFSGLVIAIVNFLMTIFSLFCIDKYGRRPLLILGLVGMSISLGMIAFSSLEKSGSDLLLQLSILSYIAFFAISLGPITWVIISEIFPKNIKASAMSLSILVNWLTNFFITFSFPGFLEKLGPFLIFLIFAFLCIFSLLFVLRYVPETKNKHFREIQTYWKK